MILTRVEVIECVRALLQDNPSKHPYRSHTFTWPRSKMTKASLWRIRSKTLRNHGWDFEDPYILRQQAPEEQVLLATLAIVGLPWRFLDFLAKFTQNSVNTINVNKRPATAETVDVDSTFSPCPAPLALQPNVPIWSHAIWWLETKGTRLWTSDPWNKIASDDEES